MGLKERGHGLVFSLFGWGGSIMLGGMLSEDTALLMKVTAFAADAHRDQRRKGARNTPYINHCLWVSQAVAASADRHADVSVLCAAILHDVVEDTPVSTAQVEALFGEAIAGLVAEVTDDKSLPKMVRKEHQVSHAPDLSPGACLIKIADKTSNVRDMATDPPPWTRERVLEYVAWAERVVSALAYQAPTLMDDFRAACQEVRIAFSAT